MSESGRCSQCGVPSESGDHHALHCPYVLDAIKLAAAVGDDQPPVRETVLDTAKSLISGDRRDAYGDVTESFTRLAALWSALLGTPVTAAQVAMCLAALKLSRLANTPDHADSWTDLAGYAALGAEVSTPR